MLIGILLFFVIIGLIPQIPFPAKLGIQLVAALIIYFGFSDMLFEVGDQFLRGGVAVPGKLNFLSVGFIGFVLGVISSVVGIGVAKLFGRKDAGRDE
ncbi:MAG: hypothetical protein AB7S38_36805 [Vulcanimicrobiota bacterium]